MESKIKDTFPSTTYEILDLLLQREYYKFDDVAIPFDVKDGYDYYNDNGKILRVDPSTLLGVGKLSNGTYLLGNYKPEWSMYLYQQVKALEKLKHLEQDASLSMIERANLVNALFEETKLRIATYYATYEKALTLEEIEKKLKGWRETSLSSYQIVDITTELNNLMKWQITNKEYAALKKLGLRYEMLPDPFSKLSHSPPLWFIFASLVGTNRAEDLKSNQKRDNRVFNCQVLYIYGDEVIDADALANITYGFLGTYLGLSPFELHGGAALAQSASEQRFTLDDPRDKKRVTQGIKLLTKDLFKNILIQYS